MLKKTIEELQKKLEEALTGNKPLEKKMAIESDAVANVMTRAEARSEISGRIPDIRELREVINPFDPKNVTCPDAEGWLENFEETKWIRILNQSLW
uniref:Uncharacterized protein n=1 Tax=Anopheles dirus TaxID=7168 RepID=A0A182NQ54_9DIPT